MPVEKFRTLDEARSAQQVEPLSPARLRQLRFVYEFWSRIRRPRGSVPRGVTRYRSIEEANAALEQPPKQR